MGQVENAVLKEHLTKTSKAVEHHLSAAKEIQTSLNQKKSS
jgi:hypothetical protein